MNIIEAEMESRPTDCNEPLKEHSIECRACLQKFDHVIGLYNLFEAWPIPWAGMGITIAEDLTKMAHVQTSTEDLLNLICIECCSNLQRACQFVQIVQSNDLILRQRYSGTTNHIDWPKPIQIESLGSCVNIPENEIKQEILSDEEVDVTPQENSEGIVDIKIEPEELLQPVHSQFTNDGGPPVNSTNESNLLGKVEIIILPNLDGTYTAYNRDNYLLASQIVAPNDSINMDTAKEPSQQLNAGNQDDHCIMHENDEPHFVNNQKNLERKPTVLLNSKKPFEQLKAGNEDDHCNIQENGEPHFVNDQENLDLLNCKENEWTERLQTMTKKTELQKENLKKKIKNEVVKMKNNRVLREIEIENAKRKYVNSEMVRKNELEKLRKKKKLFKL